MSSFVELIESGILNMGERNLVDARADFVLAYNIATTSRQKAVVSLNIGICSQKEGGFEHAFNRYSNALESAEKSDPRDPVEIARILRHMSSCLREMGFLVDAEQFAQRAWREIRHIEPIQN